LWNGVSRGVPQPRDHPGGGDVNFTTIHPNDGSGNVTNADADGAANVTIESGCRDR